MFKLKFRILLFYKRVLFPLHPLRPLVSNRMTRRELVSLIQTMTKEMILHRTNFHPCDFKSISILSGSLSKRKCQKCFEVSLDSSGQDRILVIQCSVVTILGTRRRLAKSLVDLVRELSVASGAVGEVVAVAVWEGIAVAAAQGTTTERCTVGPVRRFASDASNLRQRRSFL